MAGLLVEMRAEMQGVFTGARGSRNEPPFHSIAPATSLGIRAGFRGFGLLFRLIPSADG